MAAVLGGTRSLHTNSMDETLALPTEKSVRIALRTQQILAYESGVANTIDPLAGSYYVESLTDRLEAEALELFRRIDDLGGVARGIETGFFQKEIAESARRQQAEVEERQHRRMTDLREARNDSEVARTLDELDTSCREGTNVVPCILDCARAGCTLYEIRHAMEKTFGSYKEPVFF
jgi:methylmalonyl-CoA mutase N-terminal domain/subunit